MTNLNEPYKIAFIDIETSPNLGWVWGKWDQNVIDFKAEWHILSFSVKWAGSSKTTTYALPDFPLYKKDPENDREVIKKLWNVLDEADLVVAHNGDDFDIKKSNTRFIYHNLKPPTPYKTVDTLKLARKYFAFTSNKLDDLAKFFGVGQKIKTDFELWLGCMRGDPASWFKMKKYNAHDVVLLEKVYEKFRAWHVLHPNINVKAPHEARCPTCGSKKVHMRGWHYTLTLRQRRFVCTDCGKWSRLGKYEKLPGQMLR